MNKLEHVPAKESAQIDHTIKLTLEAMQRRYPAPSPTLRGVHPKDHGCVSAKFKVHDSLPESLRVGLFAKTGQEYEALIRFSNASTTVAADSSVANGITTHGSRGMAVKVQGVTGSALLPYIVPLTQDFLMVNHPVFGLSNVEDYEALSRILVEDKDNPLRFFAERIKRKADGTPDTSDPGTLRAIRSAGIVKRLQSTTCPPAYQPPPACPVDNQYFSGAPFAFGPDKAMKFSAKPVGRTPATPVVTDEHYLRTALHECLTAAGAKDIVFDFLVQIRDASELADKIDTEIEDACVEWDAEKHPFVSVATITIPPQDFETAERRALCEGLNFSPWHGLVEHQPLGGINRLRLRVYEASAALRAPRPAGLPDYGAADRA
ncbi:MAG: hypothetical protein QOC81_4388 [Thermoanaerobaculia bacterium]|jgi:hypothetical protein|nr:hypothetical protein [Thermoanaerobaculia bacterium]